MSDSGDSLGDAYFSVNADMEALDDSLAQVERSVSDKMGDIGDSSGRALGEGLAKGVSNADAMAAKLGNVTKAANALRNILSAVGSKGGEFRSLSQGLRGLGALFGPVGAAIGIFAVAMFAAYKAGGKLGEAMVNKGWFGFAPLSNIVLEATKKIREFRLEMEKAAKFRLDLGAIVAGKGAKEAETWEVIAQQRSSSKEAGQDIFAAKRKAEIDTMPEGPYKNAEKSAEQYRLAMEAVDDDRLKVEHDRATVISETMRKQEDLDKKMTDTWAMANSDRGKVIRAGLEAEQHALKQEDIQSQTTHKRALDEIAARKAGAEAEWKIRMDAQDKAEEQSRQDAKRGFVSTQISGISDPALQAMARADFEKQTALEDLRKVEMFEDERKLREQEIQDKYANTIKDLNKTAIGFTSLEGWWQQMQSSAVEGTQEELSKDQLTALETIVKNTEGIKKLADAVSTTGYVVFGDADE